MKKIALFDIDYTLISTDSFLELVIHIIKKHPLKIFYIPLFTVYGFLKLIGVINLTKFKEKWLILFKNMPLDQIEDLSRHFVNTIVIPKVKHQVPEVIEDMKKQGFTIVFATASFEFYLKYLADYFKADYFFGTKAVIENNKIIPRIEGLNCKGKEKITRITSVLKSDSIDRGSSFSFSDSNSDLPFLELTAVFYKVHRKKWKVIQTVEQP